MDMTLFLLIKQSQESSLWQNQLQSLFSVIGGGSIVTKDIPLGVVAAGNPCKMIRKITEKDKVGIYKEKILIWFFPK